MDALRFVDVEKRFGARKALAGLSLEIPRGSIFGLIGPNGAGKTTAFGLACGFLRPDRGQIEILGQAGFDPMAHKGRVGALPQDAALGRETTCRAHLLFFGQLQGIHNPGPEADRVLEEVGLGDRGGAKTKTLSHGMLRRLAVAQALLGTPELVLLDEPTSGLDPRHAHELRQLLRRIHRAGTTLVISSHNLVELESLCDRVAFIEEGRLKATGAVATLTGRDQDIEISLAEGPVPLDALRAALPEDEVLWDATTRIVQIRFRPQENRQAEDVIGVALRNLLAADARISNLRRGSTLETAFLKSETPRSL